MNGIWRRLGCLAVCLMLAGCAREAADLNAAARDGESAGAEMGTENGGDGEDAGNGGNAGTVELTGEAALAALDYDDYFAVDREWVDETLAYAEESGFEGDYFFVFDPELDEGGDGRLYKAPYELDYEAQVAQKELVLEDEIGSYTRFERMFDKLLFVSEGVKLVETDLDGGNRRVLYESAEPIDSIVTSRALVWMRAGNTVYRHHRQSGRTERMYTTEEPIEMWMPLSNNAFQWVQLSEAGKALRASGVEPFSEDAYGIATPLTEVGVYDARKGTARVYQIAELDESGDVPYHLNE